MTTVTAGANFANNDTTRIRGDRPWFKHYHPLGIDPYVDFGRSTLLHIFEESVKRFPNRPCISFMGKTIIYAEVKEYAQRFAAYLREQQIGIRAGDRVMILLPNCPQWTISYLGILYAGATAVLCPTKATEHQITKYIEEYGIRSVVTLCDFYPKFKKAYETLGRTNTVHGTIYTSPADFMPGFAPFFGNVPKVLTSVAAFVYSVGYARKLQKVIKEAEHQKGLCSAEDQRCLLGAEEIARKSRERIGWLHEGREEVKKDSGKLHRFGKIIHTKVTPERIHTLSKYRPCSHDTSAILLTGGTTGEPKGVVFSHGVVAYNTAQCALFSCATPGKEVFLAALPLYHVFANIAAHNAALALGGEIAMVIDASDIVSVEKTIAERRCTRLIGVPALYDALGRRALAKKHGYDFSFVEYAISGGSSLSDEVAERFNHVVSRKVVRVGYGGTEVGPVMCMPTMGPEKPGSMGIPFPGVDVKVVVQEEDGTWRAAAVGEIGEIWIKSSSTMRGYWRNSEATRKVMDPDGWFKMPDLVKMDEDGYFYHVERLGDVIVGANGEKIYPAEIEKVLATHPAVAEVGVVGVPRGDKDQIAAFVVLRAEFLPSGELEKELMAHIAEELGKYKAPQVVRFEDELPKSDLRKVLRRVLKAGELAREENKAP